MISGEPASDRTYVFLELRRGFFCVSLHDCSHESCVLLVCLISGHDAAQIALAVITGELIEDQVTEALEPWR